MHAQSRRAARLWHKGVLISDWDIPAHYERVAFAYRLLADALRLVEQCDGRRFRRIQREVGLIDIGYSPNAAASYTRWARRINLNLPNLLSALEVGGADGDDYEWFVAECACTLVHEATHGALFRRGVPYTQATRLRVERLCHREEERFAAHLPNTEYDYVAGLVSPFDPTLWEPSWNQGYRARTSAGNALIRELWGVLRNPPPSGAASGGDGTGNPAPGVPTDRA